MTCKYQCSHEVAQMCPVAKGARHQCAPIPEEGKWLNDNKKKKITTKNTDFQIGVFV